MPDFRRSMTILDLHDRPGMLADMDPNPVEPPSFVSRQVRRARRFYLNLNPHRGHKLAVICGGWEHCRPDFRMERADFPFLCIEFVAGGKGTVTLDGKEHPLHRGSVFSYGPGCPHRIVADPDDPPLKYFLDFSGREGLELLRAAGLAPGNCRTTGEAEEVEEAFEQILASGDKSGPQTERIVALKAEILLRTLAGSVAAGGGREQSYQTFLKCRDCIETRFLEFATAAEVAAACHVHPAYLSRLFALHGHESPYHTLLRHRMRHAAALLDGGGRIVREVADELGLDPFHFSRVFKRVHGLSPAEFLKRRGPR
jgi:AraC-like DNA-binding protein